MTLERVRFLEQQLATLKREHEVKEEKWAALTSTYMERIAELETLLGGLQNYGEQGDKRIADLERQVKYLQSECDIRHEIQVKHEAQHAEDLSRTNELAERYNALVDRETAAADALRDANALIARGVEIFGTDTATLGALWSSHGKQLEAIAELESQHAEDLRMIAKLEETCTLVNRGLISLKTRNIQMIQTVTTLTAEKQAAERERERLACIVDAVLIRLGVPTMNVPDTEAVSRIIQLQELLATAQAQLSERFDVGTVRAYIDRVHDSNSQEAFWSDSERTLAALKRIASERAKGRGG